MGLGELSIISSQFCCEPKTTLKKTKVLIKKRESEMDKEQGRAVRKLLEHMLALERWVEVTENRTCVCLQMEGERDRGSITTGFRPERWRMRLASPGEEGQAPTSRRPQPMMPGLGAEWGPAWGLPALVSGYSSVLCPTTGTGSQVAMISRPF